MTGIQRYQLELLPERIDFLYAEVEVECLNDEGEVTGEMHTHQVYGDVTGDVLEGTAEMLAESVLFCHQGHIGDDGKKHGRNHRSDDVARAYKEAIEQMLKPEDVQNRWSELLRKIRVWKRWGSKRPVPEAVIMPRADDPDEHDILVTDSEGTPTIYGAPKGFMPDPREFGAKPNDIMGWDMPKRWSFQRKLRQRNK